MVTGYGHGREARIVGQAVVWGQSQQGDVDVQKEDRR